MKYENKLALQIFLLGTIILSIGLYATYRYNYSTTINNELFHTVSIVDELSSNFEKQLLEKVKTNRTLSITPILKDALKASNSSYNDLSKEEINERVNFQNEKWKAIEDVNDAFIIEFTNNRTARFLKEQQNNLVGEYGEIFLTNKYGALVASTSKLSTFSHAHKYWWQGAFNEGLGAVFIDDRGYDESVDGYVLGLVIPIKEDDKIIGILKVNLNIFGAISEMILRTQDESHGNFKLIRSGGEIIFENGSVPLSKRIPDLLYEKIQLGDEQAIILKDSVDKWMIGMSEIGITSKDTDGYIFGGSFESIDHKKGNTGESWYIINYRDMHSILEPLNQFFLVVIIIGFLLIIILAALAFMLGRLAAKPLKQLIVQSNKIAKGDFSSRVLVKRKDEIGLLGKAFNNMTIDLEKNTTSIENLESEVRQRILAEQALKKQYSLFENVMNTSPFGIYIVNKNYDIEYVNPFIEKEFGSVNGRKCYEYLHGRTEKCEDGWCKNKAVFSGESVHREWFLKENKKSYALFGTPLNNPDGSVSKFEILQDITDRIQSDMKIEEQNKELQNLNATKDKLFSIIAHDLRSPFNSIIGFSELLLKHHKEFDEQKRELFLQSIVNSSKNTFNLLENLLEWARTQTGGIKFQPEEFVLEKIILETVEQLKENARQKNIQLSYEVDHSMLLYADEAMLRTVLRNLISNAIKFTPENGTIKITVTKSKTNIIVAVNDNGVGIQKEKLKNIFKSIDIESTMGTNNEKGHGLGLILCNEFIEKHKGKISVESEEGIGSTFSFFIPITK